MHRMVSTACLALASVAPSVASAFDASLIHDGSSAPARAWASAMEAGDLVALAHMHRPDTVAFPPDKLKLDGAAAIMADYAGLFAKYTVKVEAADAHWIESGPLIVSWGLTTLTLHPKAGGADIVSHTRFTDAAVRDGAGWRYVVDHASAPTDK